MSRSQDIRRTAWNNVPANIWKSRMVIKGADRVVMWVHTHKKYVYRVHNNPKSYI